MTLSPPHPVLLPVGDGEAPPALSQPMVAPRCLFSAIMVLTCVCVCVCVGTEGANVPAVTQSLPSPTRPLRTHHPHTPSPYTPHPTTLWAMEASLMT